MFTVLIGTTTIPYKLIASDTEYRDALVQEKIKFYADKYEVSFERMYNIIECETAGTFDPTIQSTVKYNFSSNKRGIKKGTQEESYGLAQIHLPDHPSISLEQAKDIDYSLDFMAKNLSQGRHLWYCEKS